MYQAYVATRLSAREHPRLSAIDHGEEEHAGYGPALPFEAKPASSARKQSPCWDEGGG